MYTQTSSLGSKHFQTLKRSQMYEFWYCAYRSTFYSLNLITVQCPECLL